MTKEDKDLQDQESASSEQTEPHEDHHEPFKGTTEKLWGSTKQAWNSAAFKANQYKKLVQKKIDLSALHKKINAAHADLGKVIDDLHDDGKKNIMNLAEVKEILTRLDELKAEAATLEEEVERIRAEGLPQGDE